MLAPKKLCLVSRGAAPCEWNVCALGWGRFFLFFDKIQTTLSSNEEHGSLLSWFDFSSPVVGLVCLVLFAKLSRLHLPEQLPPQLI